MIEKVNKLTKKSFKNYTGPTDNFKQKNIIFAYNGKGKSSLAEGILEEFKKDSSKKEENYRIYNRNYISESLILEEDNNKLRGIIANFSKNDNDIEKDIKTLQSEIKETKSLESEINNAKKAIEKECLNILDTRKGNLKIQRKNIDITNLQDTLKAYNSDLQNAKKIEKNEEELLKIKGTTNFDNQLENITKLPIATLPTLETYNLEKSSISNIEIMCKKTYISNNIPEANVISWLNEGLKIHNMNDNVCKFCGGKLDLKNIKTKINLYNDNEKQKATLAIATFHDILQEINSAVINIIDKKTFISSILGEDVKSAFEDLEKIDFKNYINNIQNKMLNMHVNVPFDATLFFNYMKIIEEFNFKIDNIKRNKIKSITEKQNKQDILVKGAIALEVIQNSLIKEKLSFIETKQKELKIIKTKNDANTKKIIELKNSKSSTKDFADFINTILLNIGIQLRLDLDGKDYILKHTNENIQLTIDDISEGEVNLLSLLFFYYELFDDDRQQNIKNNIELIIIDDPISSVDHINKMFIISLINSLLDKCNVQIFVFTHVWEDFFEFCYSRKDKNDTPFRFFEIKKNSNSFIEKTNHNETPYKHHFKEIYEFSTRNNANDLNECEIYHTPNIMRKVLEEFLKFKVTNSLPTKANISNIKIALCGNNTSRTDELSILTLLNVCNISSHECSRNPDEVLNSAKFLMKCIEKIDEQHFNTMKQ